MNRDTRVDFLTDALEAIEQRLVQPPETPTVADNVANSWAYLKRTASGKFRTGGAKLEKSVSGTRWAVTDEDAVTEHFNALNDAVASVSNFERPFSPSESVRSEPYKVSGIPMDPEALATTAITRFGRMNSLIDMIEVGAMFCFAIPTSGKRTYSMLSIDSDRTFFSEISETLARAG